MKKSLYANLILILLCSCSTNKDDYLVYVINELSGESQLIFYDPINEINVPILSGWKIDTIDLNTKNLLAFSSSHEGNSEIYILEYPFTDNIPVNITNDKSADDYVFSWSPDGHYLAFRSEQADGKTLSIWDGISKNKDKPDINSYQKIAPNLTNYYSYPVWNNAGSLTFIAFGLEDQHAQIYEWDGQAANNISKNPDSHNGGQSWGSDGYWSFATFFSSPFLYVRNERNQTQLTVEGAYASAWSQKGLLMFCSYVSAPYKWKLSMWDRKNIVEIAQGYHIIAAWRNGTKVFCSSG